MSRGEAIENEKITELNQRRPIHIQKTAVVFCDEHPVGLSQSWTQSLFYFLIETTFIGESATKASIFPREVSIMRRTASFVLKAM